MQRARSSGSRPPRRRPSVMAMLASIALVVSIGLRIAARLDQELSPPSGPVRVTSAEARATIHDGMIYRLTIEDASGTRLLLVLRTSDEVDGPEVSMRRRSPLLQVVRPDSPVSERIRPWVLQADAAPGVSRELAGDACRRIDRHLSGPPYPEDPGAPDLVGLR